AFGSVLGADDCAEGSHLGFFCFLWVVVLFQYNTQGDLRSSQWVFVTPCYQGSASTPPGTEGNHCDQIATPSSTTDWTIRSSCSSCSGSSNTIESWINITSPISSSWSSYPASDSCCWIF